MNADEHCPEFDKLLAAGALILGGLTLHTVVTYRSADKPGFPIDAPEK